VVTKALSNKNPAATTPRSSRPKAMSDHLQPRHKGRKINKKTGYISLGAKDKNMQIMHKERKHQGNQ